MGNATAPAEWFLVWLFAYGPTCYLVSSLLRNCILTLMEVLVRVSFSAAPPLQGCRRSIMVVTITSFSRCVGGWEGGGRQPLTEPMVPPPFYFQSSFLSVIMGTIKTRMWVASTEQRPYARYISNAVHSSLYFTNNGGVSATCKLWWALLKDWGVLSLFSWNLPFREIDGGYLGISGTWGKWLEVSQRECGYVVRYCRTSCDIQGNSVFPV